MEGLSIEQSELYRLLDYVALTMPSRRSKWQHWLVVPVASGRNGIVYRADSGRTAVAIKFKATNVKVKGVEAKIESSVRAQREFNVLNELSKISSSNAPLPILLNLVRYQQPVIVESWKEGPTAAALTLEAPHWIKLFQYVYALRSTSLVILPPHDPWWSDEEAFVGFLRQRYLDDIKRTATCKAVDNLLTYLARCSVWDCLAVPENDLGLSPGDHNLSNYILGGLGWSNVDWEHACYADFAWDIAWMITHPSFVYRYGLYSRDMVAACLPPGEDVDFMQRMAYWRAVSLVRWVAYLAWHLESRLYRSMNFIDKQPLNEIRHWYQYYLGLAQALLSDLTD